MVTAPFWCIVTVGVDIVVSNDIVALNRRIIIVLPFLVSNLHSINLNPIHVRIVDLSTTPPVRMVSNDLGLNIRNIFRTDFTKKALQDVLLQ